MVPVKKSAAEIREEARINDLIEAVRALHKQGVVVGAPDLRADKTTKLPARQEIDEFISDTDLCNLYLLALSEMQDHENDRDPMSWFGITSIHGVPYQSWNKIERQTGVDAKIINPTAGESALDPLKGYCSHGSALFPTWHRPYIAMVEQAIFLKIVDIAKRVKESKYPERWRSWQDAARRFRLPYFDPVRARILHEERPPATAFKSQCGLSKIFVTETVYVRGPDGFRKPIRNPLYSYKFATKGKQPAYNYDESAPWFWQHLWQTGLGTARRITPEVRAAISNWPNVETMRCPRANGRSNHGEVIQRLNLPAGVVNIGARLYKMLSENFHEADRVINAIVDVNERTQAREVSNMRRYESFATRNASTQAAVNADAGLDPRWSGANSVEAIHDTIHQLLGDGEAGVSPGPGHMLNPNYAAWDPIFFLHHCNIDRLFALWQGLHPDIPVKFSQKPGQSTFYEPIGYLQTEKSPLMPFLKIPKPNTLDSTNRNVIDLFWTSENVADWRVFNYDYEEFQNEDFFDRVRNDDRRRTPAPIQGWIDRMYSWTTAAELARAGVNRPPPRSVSGYPRINPWGNVFDHTFLIDKGTPWPSPEVIDPLPPPAPPPAPPAPMVALFQNPVSSSLKVQDPIKPSSSTPADFYADENMTNGAFIAQAQMMEEPSPLAHIIQDGTLREWDAMVRFEKFSFGGPFSVRFFLGDFKPDVKWISEKSYIGSAFSWASSNNAYCPNCQMQEESAFVIGDVVGLTHKLLEYVKTGEVVHGCKLNSLEHDDVIPFLTRNLHWRVVDQCGEELERSAVGQLKVAVAERLLDMGTNVYGAYTPWTDITNDREGGLSHGELFGVKGSRSDVEIVADAKL